MPVVTKKHTPSVRHPELKRRLLDEWRGQSSPDPRPLIIHEEDEHGVVIHVYVIWGEWGNLDQLTRSEVITDAYWEMFPEKADTLTVAMGLTESEAQRMGLSATESYTAPRPQAERKT